MKTVYIAMSADLVTPSHVNIIKEARALGEEPGGDIFFHGQGTLLSKLKPDWTWGCIAVTNDEIEEIYAMVNDGTPVSIYR